MASIPMLELHLIDVRDPIAGKWRRPRYRLRIDDARERYGEENYELLEWSREVKVGDPAQLSAAHLASCLTALASSSSCV
jgi:hypothetical protein